MSTKIQMAGRWLRSAMKALRQGLLAIVLITLAIQPCVVGQAEVIQSAQTNTTMSDSTHTTVAPPAVVPEPHNSDIKRAIMAGKTVLSVIAKTIINFKSRGFQHKRLCDGLTFNLGRTCVYSCAFCYVENQMRKLNHKVLRPAGLKHRDAVIRIEKPMEILHSQLVHKRTKKLKFKNPGDTRVIYSSTLVDIAANLDLARETAEACTIILDNTYWQIRLLSKSNLLPKLVEWIPEKYHQRLILGVSTGTLDDKLASTFEQGCPPPSKRLKSLHWLQDNGFRTFGMLCPSLPQSDYPAFARQMLDAIRVDRCEHVWAEVINVRGKSLKLTVACLRDAGFDDEALQLEALTGDRMAWRQYAWDTFRAYAAIMPEGKMSFLQYL